MDNVYVRKLRVSKRLVGKKLYAAVALLLVASLLVSTATYAWLTLSLAPEATDITTTIGANGNLEIALATTDHLASLEANNMYDDDSNFEYTTGDPVHDNVLWGNLIDLTAVDYGLHVLNMRPAVLNVIDGTVAHMPISVGAYGADGRLTSLNFSPDSIDLKTVGFAGVYDKDVADYIVGNVSMSIDDLKSGNYNKQELVDSVLEDAEYGVRIAGPLEYSASLDQGGDDANINLLVDGYCFGIDLLFRTNAPTGNLMLQTEGVQRMESELEDEYVGNGSFITISNEKLSAAMKVVFANTLTGEVYALAQADSDGKLWITARADENGTLVPTENDDAEMIKPLTQNQVSAVTAWVYIDGSLVDNSAAATKDAMEILVNLQFSTDTVLNPAYTDQNTNPNYPNRPEMPVNPDGTLSVGEKYVFGSYEQDNNFANGAEPIEWRCLAREGNKVLLISLYGLDAMAYNLSTDAVTWETSEVRSWLNSIFISNAFTEKEQDCILTTHLANDGASKHYGIPEGNSTDDKIFFLSENDALSYFANDEARLATATAYAIANGAIVEDINGVKNITCWWTRTPGAEANSVTLVCGDGAVSGGIYLRPANNESISIRPAMWITLDEIPDDTPTNPGVPEIPTTPPDAEPSTGLEYTLSDNGKYYMVSGIGTCTDVDIVIPSTYDGKPVKEIETSAFSGASNINSVIIPNSVTTIGFGAFSGCSGLTSMTIPFVGGSATPSKESYSTVFGYIFGWAEYEGGTEVTQMYTNMSGSYTSYYIPSSLQSITVTGGDLLYGAFDGCSMLKSITLPNNLTKINRNVFSDCSSLTSITIPDSVTSIGNAAFSCGSKRTDVYVSADTWENITLDSYVFDSAIHIHLMDQDGNEVTEWVIPDGETEVKANAFSNCTSLTSIIIPDSVTKIGSNAFYRCSGLTSIDIPDGVTSIGGGAFCDCSSLTVVNIPNGIERIESQVFDGCTSLTSVTIPDSVTSIGYHAFSGSGIISITIPDSVLEIDTSAFVKCYSLRSASIGNNVTSIGENAFYYCENLLSVTIGSNVTTIGEQAFDGCKYLVEVYNLSELEITCGSSDHGGVAKYALDVYTTTDAKSKLFEDDRGFVFYENGEICYLITYNGNETNLTLPTNCHGKNYEINQYAFFGRDDLISVEIPNGVTKIGQSAFTGCGNLRTVSIPPSLTYIHSDESNTEGYGSFSRCYNLVEVYDFSNLNITKGSRDNGWLGYYAKDIYRQANATSNIYTDPAGYVFYESNDECFLMDYEGPEKDLILPSSCNGKNYTIYQSAFANLHNITSVVIPGSVTEIGAGAFRNCEKLTDVRIADSVNSIGSSAFSSCKLREIIIPKSVTSIDDAFWGCETLINIIVDDQNTTYASYEGNLLSKDKTTFLYCPEGKTICEIPDSVFTIGQGAFYGHSNLRTVHIPYCVFTIEDQAFAECHSLRTIEYDGFTSDWHSIKKDAYWWDQNSTYYVVKCYDGEIPAKEA